MNSKLQGLRGDVFNLGGRVAGAVPPSGQPGSIPFSIGMVWPTTRHFPAWADMTVADGIRVRINPDICQPPFFRLFDCVKIVGTEAAKITALGRGQMFRTDLQGERFVFWPELIRGVEVIMVDTEDRVLKWNPQGAGDGQHRHHGSHSLQRHYRHKRR